MTNSSSSYQPIDFNIQDRLGSTPLMSAIQFGNESIVKFLLSSSSSSPSSSCKCDVMITNSKMRNCLHVAALSGISRMVDLILNYHHHNNNNNNTKLQDEEEDDDDLISSQDEKGMTPAHLAAYNGYTRMLCKLRN